MLDAHTTLDAVLRTYLVSRHEARFVLDKTEVNFPKLISITQQKTSERIIKAGEADSLRAFGQLRNRIAHDKAIPAVRDAQQGVELVGLVMRRLLKSEQKTPERQFPWSSIGQLSGWGLAAVAALYFILPDLIPGPVDDLLISGPLFFVAWLLIQASKKSKKP